MADRVEQYECIHVGDVFKLTVTRSYLTLFRSPQVKHPSSTIARAQSAGNQSSGGLLLQIVDDL